MENELLRTLEAIFNLLDRNNELLQQILMELKKKK
jgi:hypothetical protein